MVNSSSALLPRIRRLKLLGHLEAAVERLEDRDGVDVADRALLDAEAVRIRQAVGAEAQQHGDGTD